MAEWSMENSRLCKTSRSRRKCWTVWEQTNSAVDEEETYLRTNFSDSDNRGYRDGDAGSSRFFDRFAGDDDEDPARKMYNSPKHNVEFDSTGQIVREYDKSNNRSTLINDEVRIY